MINLDNNIKNMLHDNREVRFRYDLVNYNDIKIGELTSIPGGKIS